MAVGPPAGIDEASLAATVGGGGAYRVLIVSPSFRRGLPRKCPVRGPESSIFIKIHSLLDPGSRTQDFRDRLRRSDVSVGPDPGLESASEQPSSNRPTQRQGFYIYLAIKTSIHAR